MRQNGGRAQALCVERFLAPALSLPAGRQVWYFLGVYPAALRD